MLGLVDFATIFLNRKSKKINKKIKRIFINQPGNLTWICFLPWRTKIKTAKKYNFLPKKGNLIIYEIPDNLLSHLPQLTLKSLDDIENNFKLAMKEYNLFNKKIAFCGLSAGTMPAFYLANKYNCEKLVAVCPTGKLGEGIFSTFAAKNIKKNSIKNGVTAKSYDKSIKNINIENNLENLPNDITIYTARFDKFVPFNGGNELITKIKKKKKNINIKKYNFLGHVLTLYFFGKNNKLNF